MAALSGEARYEEQAVGVLRLFGRAAPRQPDAFAHLLRALDFHLAEVKEVALVGDDLGELLAAVRAEHRPHLVLAAGPEGSTVPPLLEGRTRLEGRPTAYVCERFTCLAPVTDVRKLTTEL